MKLKHPVMVIFMLISIGCNTKLNPNKISPTLREEHNYSTNIRNISQLRDHVDRQKQYVEWMDKALQLHDNHEVEEARRLAGIAELFNPEQSAPTWFLEKTQGNKPIRPGDIIRFTNESDHAISSINLNYRRGPIRFFVSRLPPRVEIKTPPLDPGETVEIYEESLPMGTVRLTVEVDYLHNDSLHYSSGRCYGSENGFVPTIIVRADGEIDYFDNEN